MKIAWMALASSVAGCAPAELPPLGSVDAEQLERIPRPRLVRVLRHLLDAEDSLAMIPAPAVRDELYALGKVLAHDPILSGSRDVACNTCHVVGLGTDDDLSLSIGVGGTGLGIDRELGEGRSFGARNSTPLFNLHALDAMFWDGRVGYDADDGTFTTPAGAALTPEMTAVFEFGAVSAQAMFPVTDRAEMRGDPGASELGDLADDDLAGIWDGLMARLGAIPEYVAMFEAAYPRTAFADMTFAHASNAIAGYEVRAFALSDSPFDRFLAGDDTAMTRAQLRGAIWFFTDGNCAGCHGDANLSNQAFFDTALAQIGPGAGHGATGTDDYGLEGVSGMQTERYMFRNTPLRNVELSAPYGHAGQIATLEEYMAHYADPEGHLRAYDVAVQVDDERLHGTFLDNRDALLASMDPVMRSAAIGPYGVLDLATFMRALTDDRARDLCAEVPRAVPSGLPVDDPCIGG